MPASPVSPSPSRLPTPCPSNDQHDCTQNTTLATASSPPCPLPLSSLSLLAKPTVDKVKKYYPIFGLGANVALIFFGQSIRFIASLHANLPLASTPGTCHSSTLWARSAPRAGASLRSLLTCSAMSRTTRRLLARRCRPNGGRSRRPQSQRPR